MILEFGIFKDILSIKFFWHLFVSIRTPLHFIIATSLQKGSESEDLLPTLEEFSKSASASPVPAFHKAPVLRLIDFANVTFPGFCKDDIFHEGPDQGFLFGLNNLITILEAIWKKSC
jgi:hypothetical protein